MVDAGRDPLHRCARQQGRKRTLARVPSAHDDIAFLQYTGGTTGVAKGAMLLHRNIVANMLQARAWVRPVLDDNRREVIMTPLPLYHIFSLTANCLVFMSLGGENVLITESARHPAASSRRCAEYRFTAFTGVNTLFNALLNNPKFAQPRFQVVPADARRRHGRAGGGREALEGGHGRDARRGVRAYRDFARRDDESARPRRNTTASIGLPVPSTDITLRDDAGKDVPLGEPGEICIKGPQVMAGYWQRPGRTRQT